MSLSSIITASNRLASRIKTTKILDGSPLKSRSIMFHRALSQLQRKEEEQFDPDKPVVFSTSPASESSKFTIVNKIPKSQIEKMPWYHPHATLLSLAIFMIYFLALREENDIDLAMDGSNANEYAKKLLALQKKAEFEEKRRAQKTW